MSEAECQQAVRPIEACILAGGLSSRMGRDKAKIELRGRTLLAHVRSQARQLGFPIRIIRTDLVPRCGPIGGIYSGLYTTKCEAVLFLSCDMPFVSEQFLKQLVASLDAHSEGAFAGQNGRFGFPFVLRTNAVKCVEEMLAERRFSLQELARTLKAKSVEPPSSTELFNINTPADWQTARRFVARRGRTHKRSNVSEL